jgi:anti-sigma factor RsiW
MTARPPLDPRTLELLSVSLDGRLSDREKAELDAMLEQDAGLRAQLDELRSTREQLRALPLLHPPRALTLTPAMVGGLRSPRAFPSWPMALGSALAALAFFFLVSRDLMTGGLTPGSAAPALFQVPQPATMQEDRSANPADGATEQASLAAAPDATPEEPMRKAVELPTTAPASEVSPPAPGYAAGGGPTTTEAPAESPDVENPPQDEQMLGSSDGVPEPTGEGETLAANFAVPIEEPPFDWESLIPEVEVILALVALLLGVLAVRNARSRR